MEADLPWTGTVPSHTFPAEVIGQIHQMAEEGRYEIRGWGTKRALPTHSAVQLGTRSQTRAVDHVHHVARQVAGGNPGAVR